MDYVLTHRYSVIVAFPLGDVGIFQQICILNGRLPKGKSDTVAYEIARTKLCYTVYRLPYASSGTFI